MNKSVDVESFHFLRYLNTGTLIQSDSDVKHVIKPYFTLWQVTMMVFKERSD